MAQMPDIQPEINKEPQKEKKRGGFLARLFGGGSGGGTVGAGAFGGAGAGAGGGGLLATKAGLLALILVGTTVAGGIGLIGYRLFGPGSDQNNGDGVSLFAVKPKENASNTDAANRAPKDGSSASLDYLAKANSTPKEPELKPAETPKDEVAANAASAGKDAAAAGANGALNAAGSAGNGVSKGLLKTGANFGGLSKSMGGGGGSSAVSTVPSKTSTGADALANGGKGNLSALKKGPAAAGGAARSVASRRGVNSGMRQALGALADNRGATTSYGAGRTYDGSAAQNSGPTGPAGGEIGMGGPGTGTGAQPTSSPNTANQSKEFKAPPTPTSVDAAPWQNAINTAKMLIGIASLLMLLAFALKGQPWFKSIKMVLAALVTALGVAVIALGAQIAGGQYGQKAQGAVLGAAGLGLTIMGAAMLMDGDKATFKGQNTTGASLDGSGAGAVESTPVGGETTSATQTGGSSGIFGMNPMVAIGGGIAVMGLIGSMMMPVQKYPSKDFANGNPPDTHFF